MIYAVGIVIVGFLHVLLRLSWKATGVLCVFAICAIPFHQKL